LGEVSAKVLNIGQAYIRTLENERHFTEFANIEKLQFPCKGAEIWGGAFWKIRRLLGRKEADTLLFETWRDASSSRDENVSAEQFLTVLMSRSQHSLQATQVEGIQQILKKRGFPLP
jgi:hypothetical protein